VIGARRLVYHVVGFRRGLGTHPLQHLFVAHLRTSFNPLKGDVVALADMCEDLPACIGSS